VTGSCKMWIGMWRSKGSSRVLGTLGERHRTLCCQGRGLLSLTRNSIRQSTHKKLLTRGRVTLRGQSRVARVGNSLVKLAS